MPRGEDILLRVHIEMYSFLLVLIAIGDGACVEKIHSTRAARRGERCRGGRTSCCEYI